MERAFTAEIEGALSGGLQLYQTRSIAAKELANDGYLIEQTIELGGRFPVTVCGYALTELGRFAYCTSPRCAEPGADE